HVHGVVVHVLAVAHVLPSLAAVEAADDAADLDRPVDLPGVGRIDGELEHALGRVRARPDGHIGEADRDRQLPPVVSAVLAPEDLAVLVARVEHARVARIEGERPYGRAVVADVEPLPSLTVVRAAVWTVLGPDVDRRRILGMRDDRPDGGLLGKAAS